MQKTLRPLAAEFIGVFMLTFIGAGAIVLNTYHDGSVGLLGIAIAFGLGCKDIAGKFVQDAINSVKK